MKVLEPWKCTQTGSRCYDLPDDCSIVCACAALSGGTVTKKEIENLQELHRFRREKMVRNEGRKSVAMALGLEGLAKLEAAE